MDSPDRDVATMRKDGAVTHLTVVGKLPEGYIILCDVDGDEHSFLARSLGVSVECPHCGATRCSVELAQEYFLGRDALHRRDGTPTRYDRLI
jgi:hypothetical protein